MQRHLLFISQSTILSNFVIRFEDLEEKNSCVYVKIGCRPIFLIVASKILPIYIFGRLFPPPCYIYSDKQRTYG